MSYKDEKIVKILLEEANKTEVRCPGYIEEFTEALAEVVQKEREHLFQRINIAVEVGDIIGRVSTFVDINTETTDKLK